jgi:hypothetical protein
LAGRLHERVIVDRAHVRSSVFFGFLFRPALADELPVRRLADVASRG